MLVTVNELIMLVDEKVEMFCSEWNIALNIQTLVLNMHLLIRHKSIILWMPYLSVTIFSYVFLTGKKQTKHAAGQCCSNRLYECWCNVCRTCTKCWVDWCVQSLNTEKDHVVVFDVFIWEGGLLFWWSNIHHILYILPLTSPRDVSHIHGFSCLRPGDSHGRRR